MAKIVLVRHGRSAHVHVGAIDLAGFHRWREAYEAAGIDEDDPPPAELKALAANAGIVVASEAPRAVQSAALLVPSFVTSPLLGELELAPPAIRGIRMPLFGWALAFGVRSLIRAHVTAGEIERAREAAEWLSELADRDGTVLAVTHHSIRELIAERLIADGWRAEIPRKRRDHWSAWSFTAESTRNSRTL